MRRRGAPGGMFEEVGSQLVVLAEGLVTNMAVEVLLLLQLAEGTAAREVRAVVRVAVERVHPVG